MNLFAPLIRLPDGWAENVTLNINDQGIIVSLDSGSPQAGANVLCGPVIPGMPNTHSHAFQRLMAGLAEWRSSSHDNFWSWRELMYRVAAQVTPPIMKAVASHLYIEMLKAGYTSVCEFHYLHHQNNGAPFNPPTAMSDALIESAAIAGIDMTLLPTLYMRGGFDNRELLAEQRRFCHQLDDYQHLLTQLRAHENALLKVGAAHHSLRAVSPVVMRELQVFLDAWSDSVPIHIHVAEQHQEVHDAVEHLGKRPVEWLMDNLDFRQHWCLVHATHMTEKECQKVANSTAVISVCPTTEANLGDGIFPFADYLSHDGRFCIGSDSQISVSPIEELRWLEYAQRLDHQKRTVAATANRPNCGDFLWNSAVSGGAFACGHNTGGLGVGSRADFLVLNSAQLPIHFERSEQILDALVFAGSTSWIKDVFVRGMAVVKDGHHLYEAQALREYHEAMKAVARAS